jgi:hypothetical protein
MNVSVLDATWWLRTFQRAVLDEQRCYDDLDRIRRRENRRMLRGMITNGPLRNGADPGVIKHARPR